MPEIRGRGASAEEERVAKALDKYGHTWDFQFEIFTITGVKGSYVLDFLVKSTVPFSTPLEVFGAYWHSPDISREDQLRLQRIEFELGPNINETVILFGKELQTQAAADEAVLRTVGRA
ncbi:hypothetical protein LCGC14_0922010 [marine sediment metagenome]|uniref:Uncharacterized protein n=1 Tax=marine sediment metagenome TaxID=412755 RepID=A0A0F9NQL1_9ZZZZ